MAASLLGRAVASTRGARRLTDKYGFRLSSPLLSKDAAFETASELKISTEVIKYRSGGSLLPVKNPGLSDHDPFTAGRAATTGIHDLYTWKNLVTFAAQGGSFQEGSPLGKGSCEPSDYKCVIDVVQTNRCHQAIKRWRLFGAWPSEFSAIDGLDNNSSDHVRESITWEYDFFVLADPITGADISVSIFGSAFSQAFGLDFSQAGFNFNPRRL